MKELTEAIHRIDTGVNQSPGLEDKLSQGDSVLFQVSTAHHRGSSEECRMGDKVYSSALCQICVPESCL